MGIWSHGPLLCSGQQPTVELLPRTYIPKVAHPTPTRKLPTGRVAMRATPPDWRASAATSIGCRSHRVRPFVPFPATIHYRHIQPQYLAAAGLPPPAISMKEGIYNHRLNDYCMHVGNSIIMWQCSTDLLMAVLLVECMHVTWLVSCTDAAMQHHINSSPNTPSVLNYKTYIFLHNLQ